MRSSKSRSRNKSNRNRSPLGNVVNRVFDSSGPEGKVRGTPQQIIDKYNQLARDSQLSGDRVATENFQQHAEHYLRLLAAAQKEQDAKREEQERQNRERQAERDRDRSKRQDGETPKPAVEASDDPAAAPQPDVIDTSMNDNGLVETPEAAQEMAPAPKPKKPRAPRKPKAKTPEAEAPAETAPSEADAGPSEPQEAAE